jgi:1-acyl-sn-glycerol-3-phosphate acyltransferase
MGLRHSFGVLAAMARVTAPTFIDLVRGEIDRDAVDKRTRWFGKNVVDVLDVQLDVSGTEYVDPKQAYVYMANHQSHLDIPILFATVPTKTLRMVGKIELFKIPVWGHGLKAAEFIAIDRSDRNKAIASIDRCATLLKDGVSVFIAPEGTRSVDGTVGALKKGGFHLAADTGAAILPVAISGTINILPRGARVMTPGRKVKVVFGPPIRSDQPIEQMMTAVKKFLEDNVERYS